MYNSVYNRIIINWTCLFILQMFYMRIFLYFSKKPSSDPEWQLEAATTSLSYYIILYYILYILLYSLFTNLCPSVSWIITWTLVLYWVWQRHNWARSKPRELNDQPAIGPMLISIRGSCTSCWPKFGYLVSATRFTTAQAQPGLHQHNRTPGVLVPPVCGPILHC